MMDDKAGPVQSELSAGGTKQDVENTSKCTRPNCILTLVGHRTYFHEKVAKSVEKQKQHLKAAKKTLVIQCLVFLVSFGSNSMHFPILIIWPINSKFNFLDIDDFAHNLTNADLSAFHIFSLDQFWQRRCSHTIGI